MGLEGLDPTWAGGGVYMIETQQGGLGALGGERLGAEGFCTIG